MLNTTMFVIHLHQITLYVYIPTIPDDFSSKWIEYDERTATTVRSNLKPSDNRSRLAPLQQNFKMNTYS